MKKQLNRRQWLRTAGLAGAATLVGGTRLASAKDNSPLFVRKAEGIAKLNANENPYGPSPKVREALIEAFDLTCRYPFSHSGKLVGMIAEKEGVSPEHVLVTAGSTEGLRLAGMVYGMEGGEVVTAFPAFKTLLSYAEKFGAHVNKVPLTDELQHDLAEMDRRITHKTSLVYVCNPNNPTGTINRGGELKDFCASVSRRTMTFVDEAYYDFIEEDNYPSMIELVREGHNLIVARTFSKVYGLAGLRIGYLIARPDIIERIGNYMVAFTNSLALKAAEAALEDEEFYRFSLQKNAEAKALIYQTLDQLDLPYQRSHTNFVFFKSGKNIVNLMEDMRAQQVIIGRPFPPMTDWCRISTGTMEDTRAFCEGLKEVMG
ncbi:MAG: histidinol-phosphate transaminase [Saprospiraceae bacterium]|nr:histidinol-phosphate transaminase [Saprospiraceae bacterium]